MTLTELLDDLLIDIDEDKQDIEIVNKVKRFINRGHKELAKREGLSKTKDLVINDGKAKLPFDCAKVYHCYDNGINIEFKIIGKYIYANAESVTVHYNYIPDNLAEHDEFETNANNVEFIMLFAKYLYYFSESLSEEAAIFKTEYENYRIEKNKPNIEKIIDVYGVI